MKKILILVLLVLVGVSLFNLPNLKADESRTIAHKFIVVTADAVVSAHGGVVFKVSGYANANSSVYGIYNAATINTAIASNCAVEGGEATQYDTIPPIDFGDDGLVLDTGITVLVDGAYVSLEYL